MILDNKIKIRAARVEDAQELLNIYAYYVLNSALTFEYEVPSLENFQNRIANTLKTYPYLVAELDNRIVGYAYAGRFHQRAAYAWNAEMSIYLNKDNLRCGVGKKLYNLLEKILKAQGIVKTIALITSPVDEYSDFNSVQFHEKMGYNHAGRLVACGYKFDHWYTTLYMDKFIQKPQNNMQPIKTFDDVRKVFGL